MSGFFHGRQGIGLLTSRSLKSDDVIATAMFFCACRLYKVETISFARHHDCADFIAKTYGVSRFYDHHPRRRCFPLGRRLSITLLVDVSFSAGRRACAWVRSLSTLTAPGDVLPLLTISLCANDAMFAAPMLHNERPCDWDKDAETTMPGLPTG